MIILDKIFSFFTDIQWSFLSIITILIFRKPLIDFCQRFVSLSFDLMGQKAQINAIEPTKQKREISEHIDQRKNLSDADKPEEENVKQLENSSNCYIFNMWEAFKDKKYDKAKNIFESCYKDETDMFEKVRIESTYLRFLYTEAGKKSGLIDLEKLIKNCEMEKQKRIALFNLSICYSMAKNYVKVIELWKTAIDESKDEINKTHYISNLADAYIKNNQIDIAASMIESQLKTVSSNEEKAILYKSISSVEKACGNNLMAALAFEKAIEMNPDDQGLLYSGAHLQASTDLSYLAINNYDTLIALDSDNKAAVNNLGALAADLSIKTKGIELYKKSAEMGNTVAISNLAGHYLFYGFIEDAKKMVKKAQDHEKSNEDIADATARIHEKVENDNKRWNEILKKGNKYREYARRYTSAYYNEGINPAEFSGEWITGNQEQFEITVDDNKLFANWQVDVDNVAIGKGYGLSLAGTVHNNSAIVMYKKELIGEKPKSRLRINQNINYKCYAYISSDGNKMVIFSIDAQEEFSLELNRHK